MKSFCPINQRFFLDVCDRGICLFSSCIQCRSLIRGVALTLFFKFLLVIRPLLPTQTHLHIVLGLSNQTSICVPEYYPQSSLSLR